MCSVNAPTSDPAKFDAVVVFVHLGSNQAPTLVDFATSASMELPNSQMILLCDYPSKFADFPGQVIQVNRKLHTKKVKRYFRRHWEFSGISGGYWRYSLERIFVLAQIKDFVSELNPIIHIESDVLSLINTDILKLMKTHVKKMAAVRYTENDGIATVIYSPNIHSLEDGLQELVALLPKEDKYSVDMDLLGRALNLGILQELPTYPNEDWVIQNEPKDRPSYVVFDGLHIGQYLFGRDPVHNNGFLEVGHQNPTFNWDKFEKGFEISFQESQSMTTSISFNYDGKRCICACLHVHSKRLVPLPVIDSKFWEPFIMASNGYEVQFPKVLVQDLIHNSHDPFTSRIKRKMSQKIRKVF
jgi:hypothetical protein